MVTFCHLGQAQSGVALGGSGPRCGTREQAPRKEVALSSAGELPRLPGHLLRGPRGGPGAGVSGMQCGEGFSGTGKEEEMGRKAGRRESHAGGETGRWPISHLSVQVGFFS